MEYLDGNATTRYIDPKSFVDGNRAVFDLKGHHLAVLPNMRLLDVGVFGKAGGIYNELIGATSIIDHIALYDGRTELSKLDKVGLWAGWKAVQHSNSSAMSMSSQLACSKVGYQVVNTTGLGDYTLLDQTSAAARADSQGAYIKLSSLLPILRNVNILPSDLFKNLRLEVVFNTQLTKQIMSDITDTITGQLIPVLAIDIMDDPKIVSAMSKGFKGVMWNEIERDQVFYPQAPANGVGTASNDLEEIKSFKLDGFKNKYLGRMLQVKENAVTADYVDTNDVRGWGRYGSVALYNEKIQVRLNGSNIFPRQGLEGANQRLKMLVNTWGDIFSYPGANQVDINSGIVIGASAAEGLKKKGQLDWNGWSIQDRVVDLQIIHSRTGLQDSADFRPSTNALNVHYFAEVRKTLNLKKGGGYNISYM